jgi:hypothetical protein
MLFQTVGSQDLHVTVNLRKEKQKAEKEKQQQQQNSQSVGGCVVELELELSHHMTSCFNQCRPCTSGMVLGEPWSYESNSQTLPASMLAIATELGFCFLFF